MRICFFIRFVFYRVWSLNEVFKNAKPNQTENFQIFAPKMPLETAPLCITLHVKNLSDTERDLKLFKRLSCDCSLNKNRLRKAGKRAICPHKCIVDIRPTFEIIRANCTMELDLTIRYELMGQQEVNFMVLWVNWNSLASGKFCGKTWHDN